VGREQNPDCIEKRGHEIDGFDEPMLDPAPRCVGAEVGIEYQQRDSHALFVEQLFRANQ